MVTQLPFVGHALLQVGGDNRTPWRIGRMPGAHDPSSSCHDPDPCPDGGPARPHAARRAHPRRRGGPLRVGVHPRDRPAAAGAQLHPRGAGAAERQPHAGRGAGAAAAAGLGPALHGRERGAAGRAAAGWHRPQLRLPGQDREPAPRRRRAAGRAGAGGPHRGVGAARRAGGHPGVGQDAAGRGRHGAHARLRPGHRGGRRQRAGGARPHQGAGLPAAGTLGAHRRVARTGAPAAGGQRRDLERAGRAALPRRHWLHQSDGRPRHGAPPGAGTGAACLRCRVGRRIQCPIGLQPRYSGRRQLSKQY